MAIVLQGYKVVPWSEAMVVVASVVGVCGGVALGVGGGALSGLVVAARVFIVS